MGINVNTFKEYSEIETIISDFLTVAGILNGIITLPHNFKKISNVHYTSYDIYQEAFQYGKLPGTVMFYMMRKNADHAIKEIMKVIKTHKDGELIKQGMELRMASRNGQLED